MLRFANVLGPDVRTSHTQLFSLPAVPMILGFDPRYQFVHEDDVVHALEHVVLRDLPGIYNVAGDGVLALSEVAGLLGKPYAPILPPFGTGLAASALRRLGLRIPPEMLDQLRFGRGVDNRRLKSQGFEYQYTSREAVVKLAEHLRLHPLLRGAQEPYRYEREVEEFLRWSPNVRAGKQKATTLSRSQLVELRKLLDAFGDGAEVPDPVPEPSPQPPAEPRPEPAPKPQPPAARAPVDHYDDLRAEEVISLLRSLEPDGLQALRDYEAANRGRDSVIGAIDSVLARAR
jgi:UDP-glucose 4-epimerase